MYSERATIEYVGIDHGGAHVLMAQQLLDGADVLPAFQEMSCKGVAEGVAACSMVTLVSAMARFMAFCTTLGSRW